MKIFGVALSDYGWILNIANLVGAVGWGFVAFYIRQSFASKADFQDVSKRLSALEALAPSDLSRRVTMVEADLRLGDETLATKEDVAEIVARMEHQDGDRRELSAKVEGVDSQLKQLILQVGMLNKYLLTGGSK